jgi:hypothetical protein
MTLVEMIAINKADYEKMMADCAKDAELEYNTDMDMDDMSDVPDDDDDCPSIACTAHYTAPDMTADEILLAFGTFDLGELMPF